MAQGRGAGTAAAAPCGASTQPSGYSPAQIQDAYRLPSATSGAGMLVAVVTPFDDPDAEGDLCVYRTQYGLNPCTSADGCLTEVNEQGSASPLPGPNPAWGLDTSAHLDMISATCPNCHILLVETSSASIPDIGTGVNTAVSMGADVVTIGVAAPETTADTSYDSQYFNHPGVVITAAAGSNGYGVSYPAASPDVIAVGGTSLTTPPQDSTTCATGLAPSISGWCETVWNDLGSGGGATGSGCSAFEPKPSWQQDTGCATRTDNDLSADADPSTGVAVYDSDGEGGWQPGSGLGGTVVAAAIVAGAYALVGPNAASPAANPYLNGIASSVNDITIGSSQPPGSSCTPDYLCTAGDGYDGPTGRGSPGGIVELAPSGLSGVIHSAKFGKCLDNSGGNSANNNKIDITTCNAAWLQQQWAVKPNGTIQILNEAGGLLQPIACLDVSGGKTANDSLIVLFQCNGSASQQWIPMANGNIINPHSGLCLDDPNGSTTNGTQLQIRTCGAFLSQEWALPYPTPKTPAGEIVARDTGLCLDNHASSLTIGNVIDVHACNAGPDSQEWTVESDGTIRLPSSFCLDVSHSGATSGSPVDLWDCNGSDSQQWQELSDGALYNPESALCLADPGSYGPQLEVKTCDQSPDQSWTLPPASHPS